MSDAYLGKRARIMLGTELAKDAEQHIVRESFAHPDHGAPTPYRDHIRRVEITIYSNDIDAEPYQAGVDVDFSEKT